MGGDFLAFQIHKDSKYFQISNDELVNGLKVTNQNMWRFPNLLKPIGLEAKIYPSKNAWQVDSAALEKLLATYNNMNIVLPAHWYNDISVEKTNGLFSSAVRLIAKEKHVLKIAYALWWIKSHVVANEIWPHRQEELEEYFKSNEPNRELMKDILSSYHNWKYMSIKYNLLNNGNLDLNYYIRNHFAKLYSEGNKILYTRNYQFIDIDNLYYNSMDNIELIERRFDVKIDRSQVKEYASSNLDLIQECLGFNVDDRRFENDETYFDAIINYAKDIINERTDHFDYYNRKRSS